MASCRSKESPLISQVPPLSDVMFHLDHEQLAHR